MSAYTPAYCPVTPDCTCLGVKGADVCQRCERRVSKATGKTLLDPPATSSRACRFRKLKAREGSKP